MVDIRALLSLLLVAGFHLPMSYSAPVDIPLVNPTRINVNAGEVLVTIPTQRQPSITPTGSTINTSAGSGGNQMSSTTPRPAGTVTGLRSTGSPIPVTSHTGNVSGQPVSHSSGGALTSATTGSSNTGSSNTGSSNTGSSNTSTSSSNTSSSDTSSVILNVNRNISTFTIPAFTNAQPHVPVSLGFRPPVVNGHLVNPCPDQCPNGLGGNPPCVCAVSRV
ncbi:uncharacterized protein [Engystomops pustulosus]|uniref:uncharacterized protein isoform X2 n=1 Tax=Engystomops pustulosus TaxID=76066 RepID=UPI003AFA9DCF